MVGPGVSAGAETGAVMIGIRAQTMTTIAAMAIVITSAPTCGTTTSIRGALAAETGSPG